MSVLEAFKLLTFYCNWYTFFDDLDKDWGTLNINGLNPLNEILYTSILYIFYFQTVYIILILFEKNFKAAVSYFLLNNKKELLDQRILINNTLSSGLQQVENKALQ